MPDAASPVMSHAMVTGRVGSYFFIKLTMVCAVQAVIGVGLHIRHFIAHTI
jgi:hypothetical protein